MTTREEIWSWLHEGHPAEATHMIVAVDTFDYEDYPVWVTAHQDVHEEEKRLKALPMTGVVEVYCLAADLHVQIGMERCKVYGPEDIPAQTGR